MPVLCHLFGYKQVYYPQFRKDIGGLINAGIIKYIGENNYSREREKTSLALYFLWVGHDVTYVSGGFWAPIEAAFTVKGETIKRNTLSRLASKKRNNAKQPESDDFLDIKNIVIKYREFYSLYIKAETCINDITSVQNRNGFYHTNSC
jgi:hypothetical protein